MLVRHYVELQRSADELAGYMEQLTELELADVL